jgi:hypothetical protein
LPFAVGLGVETSIARVVIIVPAAGIVLGVLGTAFALALWCGPEWMWRLRMRGQGGALTDPRMQSALPTSLEPRVKQVLVEPRVMLPGAQALLGFQLAAMLTEAFGQLPTSSRFVHAVPCTWRAWGCWG